MNESEARSILGVSNTATLQEARKAYKSLIKVLHPDVNSATPEQAQQATQATARVNQAWDTLQDLSARGLLGRFVEEPQSGPASGAQFKLRPRQPSFTECTICGSTPATPASFRFLQTFLIWLQTGSLAGSFCRSCGLEVFRDAQSRTLTRAWWGIGVVALPFIAVANVMARSKVAQQAMPAYRDFNVITPTDQPLLPGRPVLRRPLVLAVLAVVVIGAFIFVGGSLPSSNVNRASTSAAQNVTPPTPAVPQPAPNATKPTDTAANLSDAERARFLADLRQVAEDNDFTKRQAKCVADAVGLFNDDELIEFANGVEGASLQAKVDGIFKRCRFPAIGECYEERGISFVAVNCGDPKAQWRVVASDIAAKYDACSAYPAAFQVDSLAFCMKRNR